MNNMKKILLILIVMFLITSCGSDIDKVKVMEINKTDAVIIKKIVIFFILFIKAPLYLIYTNVILTFILPK